MFQSNIGREMNATFFSFSCVGLSLGFPPKPHLLPPFLPPLLPPPSTCVTVLLFAPQAAAVCPHHSSSSYLLARLAEGCLFRLDSLVLTNGWNLFPSKHGDFLKSEWELLHLKLRIQ